MTVWAIQWTGPRDYYSLDCADAGNGLATSLCEVEGHVVYEVGTEIEMRIEALRLNTQARQSRYRAVPLPWTGPAPDYLRDRNGYYTRVRHTGAHL